jgi:hypothetical protein
MAPEPAHAAVKPRHEVETEPAQPDRVPPPPPSRVQQPAQPRAAVGNFFLVEVEGPEVHTQEPNQKYVTGLQWGDTSVSATLVGPKGETRPSTARWDRPPPVLKPGQKLSLAVAVGNPHWCKGNIQVWWWGPVPDPRTKASASTGYGLPTATVAFQCPQDPALQTIRVLVDGSFDVSDWVARGESLAVSFGATYTYKRK